MCSMGWDGMDAMVYLCRLPCVINSWVGVNGRESGVGFGLAEIVVGEGAFPSIRGFFPLQVIAMA